MAKPATRQGSDTPAWKVLAKEIERVKQGQEGLAASAFQQAMFASAEQAAARNVQPSRADRFRPDATPDNKETQVGRGLL